MRMGGIQRTRRDGERADGGDEQNLKDVAAPTLREVEHEDQRGDEAKDRGQQMRCRGKADRDGEQYNARTPTAARPLHGVRDSHGGVDEAVESPHGEESLLGATAMRTTAGQKQ